MDVLLLGHYDSPLTAKVQKQLARALVEQYGPKRVRLVQIGVRPAETRLQQYAPLPAGREATTRSRSIIFLSLGLAAASACGSGIPLYVPENGFIALNVPLVGARLGSCSTRTTHPYFIVQLRTGLAAVGLANPIVNPFERLTKGEILNQCRNQLLLRRLACQTVSCAHPDVGRYERIRYGNCGYCFPCLIRRASLYSIGLDDGQHYTHDVCTEGDLVGGRGTRGRDTRALFAALQSASVSGRLTPLLSGPLPDKTDLRDMPRMYRQGLEELRSFFMAKSNADVRHIAGL